MIWRSSKNTFIAQLADFLTAFLCFNVSYFLWHKVYENLGTPLSKPAPFTSSYLLLFIILSTLYVFLFRNYKAYNFLRFTSLNTEYSIILKVTVFAFLIDLSLTFLFNLTELRRTFFILVFIISLILFLIQKTLLFYIAKKVRKEGLNRKSVIIVGTGKKTEEFLEKVERNFDWGLDIIGLITDGSEEVNQHKYGHKIIGACTDIESILKNYNPGEIIITLSSDRFSIIKGIIEACEKIGIKARFNSDFFSHITRNLTVDQVLGLNIISFNYVNQSEFELLVKRLFDLILSIFSIILLSPLMMIIAIIIYARDGRPVLYQWQIMGKDRIPIKSWKFRTMLKNADDLKKKLKDNNEMNGPMFKMTNDPRILPTGYFLRKYSFDELPQLFSVLKGDISLVGPRPPLQSEYKEFDLWHRRKLSVKPGMTCLWQISGRNNINDFNEWAKLDLQYIDNWSLWLDIKILFKTISVVLKGSGK